MHLRPAKVIAAKGEKSVLQVTNAERGENVTVMTCCSASGYYVPPMVIFKGQRQKAEFADGMPPGTLKTLSDMAAVLPGASASTKCCFDTGRTCFACKECLGS